MKVNGARSDSRPVTAKKMWLLCFLVLLSSCSQNSDTGGNVVDVSSLDGLPADVGVVESSEDVVDSAADLQSARDQLDLSDTEMIDSGEGPAGSYFIHRNMCELVSWTCGNAAELDFVEFESSNSDGQYWTTYRFSGDIGEIEFRFPCSSSDGRENCAGFEFEVSDNWFVVFVGAEGELRNWLVNAFAEVDGALVDIFGNHILLENLEVFEEEFLERAARVPEGCEPYGTLPVTPWCPDDITLHD